MYLINTSFHVHTPIYDEVLGRVADSLVPAMTASGLFRQPLMGHILVEVDQDSRSFTLQALADDLDAALAWLQSAPMLTQLTRDYPGRALFFTTPMEVIK
jgi:hypothetical protein